MAVEIHPTAIVDPSAEIGDGSVINALTIVGPNVKMGKNNVIGPQAHIQRDVIMGDNNKVDSFTSIGGDPQDLSYKGGQSFVHIGDNNTFREIVTVNRGTAEGSATVIGNNCFFMGGAHVGHNCELADNIIQVNHAGLAGYTIVERNAFIAGLCAVHQYCRIGAYAMLGFKTKVTQDIPPFTMCVGATDPVIVGLNSVGLKRGGFSPEDRRTIKEMFKLYYLSKIPRKDALEKIKALGTNKAVVKEWLDFVEGSKRGITPYGTHSQGG